MSPTWEELFAVEDGANCATNQVMYNLTRRGIEFDLVPWCRERGMPIMAYSPIEQGLLARHPDLVHMAKAYQATPAQLALAFVLAQPGMVAIPKTSDPHRVEENVAALDITITDEDQQTLDALFRPRNEKCRWRWSDLQRHHTVSANAPYYMPCGPRFMAAIPVRQISLRPSGFMTETNWSIFDDLPVISKMK